MTVNTVSIRAMALVGGPAVSDWRLNLCQRLQFYHSSCYHFLALVDRLSQVRALFVELVEEH